MQISCLYLAKIYVLQGKEKFAEKMMPWQKRIIDKQRKIMHRPLLMVAENDAISIVRNMEKNAGDMLTVSNESDQLYADGCNYLENRDFSQAIELFNVLENRY